MFEKKSVLSVWCFLLMVSGLFAQDVSISKERKAEAEQAIQNLKEGVLVVRLRSKAKNIAALERVLAREDLSASQRKRHEGILEGMIKKRDAFNRAMVAGFESSFEFTDTYYMLDTNSHQLRDGVRTGLFLNNTLEMDASITLKQGPIFIVDYKENTSDYPFDAMEMRMLKSKIEKPFPYFVPVRSSWLSSSKLKVLQKSVLRWNKTLETYYEKTKS